MAPTVGASSHGTSELGGCSALGVSRSPRCSEHGALPEPFEQVLAEATEEAMAEVRPLRSFESVARRSSFDCAMVQATARAGRIGARVDRAGASGGCVGGFAEGAVGQLLL